MLEQLPNLTGKKIMYFENQAKEVGNDSNKLWSVLHDLAGKKNKTQLVRLESSEVANYLNDYFLRKLQRLRENKLNLSENIALQKQKVEYRSEKPEEPFNLLLQYFW